MIVISPAILLILFVMFSIIIKRAIFGPFKCLNLLSLLVFAEAVDKCKVERFDSVFFNVEVTQMAMFVFFLFVVLIQANILVEVSKIKRDSSKKEVKVEIQETLTNATV